MDSSIRNINEINDGIVFLRKITKNDVKFLYNNLNNEDIIRYISIGPLKSLNHAKYLVKLYLKYWNDYKQFNYIIEIDEFNFKCPIGIISLWNLSWLNKRGEIGIWTCPRYWRRGYAKRAIHLIKNLAYDFLKINRLEVHITTENHYSINLFKDCEFKQESILRDYLFIRNKFHDAVVLASIKRINIK